MRIAVSGSSGLVGRALVPRLVERGHEVVRLVRGAPRDSAAEIEWTPEGGLAEPKQLENFDAVVHLAGKSIASGRWTESLKREIRDSRVDGTRRLVQGLAGIDRRPRVLVCASAVGYYGSRGDEVLTETSAPGDDFLARVCVDWEAAARAAVQAGVRVVHLRFGMILSAEGGALAKMLRPFRLCLGGRVGNGRQFWSWIARDDAVGAILRSLEDEGLDGPINAVAPRPSTSAEFTRALGRALDRPTPIPMPAFAARAAFGEMAGALLLASQRVEPARLTGAGFVYRHPELEPALRAIVRG